MFYSLLSFLVETGGLERVKGVKLAWNYIGFETVRLSHLVPI